jgi:trichothecene 3-O-acetyltransferase
MEDYAAHLDVLGQSSGLYKLYTQLCLCFSTSDSASEAHVVDTLNHGLQQLTTRFPWVAGQVVVERGHVQSEQYKIRPFQKAPRFVTKSSKDDPSLPSIKALREAGFPFSMLDESGIASINTFAGGTDAPAPVFEIQANFVAGGLILTFATQHNVMDMTGMAQVMYLLSKACHNEPFTAEELRIGNLDRRNLVPLLDDSYTPGPELAHQIKKPPPVEQPSHAAEARVLPNPPAESVWAYFLFSGASLTALKQQAMNSLPDPSSYVSTDDVLSALIWQAVTKARLPRLNPDEKTIFARAIDPRRYLDVPATYPGVITNMAYSTSNAEKLTSAPLGTVAAELRTRVDPKTADLGYATRGLATCFTRAEDKDSVGVTVNLDVSKDMMLSSWAKYDAYELDFNLGLGKPEAVRRPRFPPFEGLFYLMPKRTDGEIAVALCLRLGDMERLKHDQEFMKHTHYIG